MVKNFTKLLYVSAYLCILELGYLWYSGSVSSLLFFRTASKSDETDTTSLRDYHDNSPGVNSKLSATTSTVSSVSSEIPDDKTSVSTHYTSPSAVISKLTIEEKVERCMRMANLDSKELITQARDNAKYFLDEYRKVIPENGLKGYRSHCWKDNYSAKWESGSVSGNMGKVTFQSVKMSYYPFNNVVPNNLARLFKSKQYESSVLCLPKVYLLGYEKCGSTFLFTFIDHLIAQSTNSSIKMEFAKETQYWARFEAYKSYKKHVPKVESLGMYLLNYIPGMDAVSKQNKTDVVLIDGTPNYMVEWPIFLKTENNLSNYCLLPAALPTLFTGSKYIAIMRNPLDMLYSNFWFSCTKQGIKFRNQTKGPDIFHDRIMPKIHTFNNCMRNASVPSISSPCVLDDSYSACITQRLHLLDQCSDDIIANKYSPELPRCGETTLYYGIFYIHIRKWLSLVGRENLLLLTLEKINQSPGKVANDTLQFLELNRLSSTEIDKFVKKIMESGRKHSQSTVNYKSDPELQMRPDTKLALETFYHPFNLLLVELLDNSEFMWF